MKKCSFHAQERASDTMAPTDLEAVSGQHILTSETYHEVPTSNSSSTDAYNRAISTGLFQKDMEQLVPVTLAYASYEKRQLTSEDFDENAFASMIGAVEGAINTISKSTRFIDHPWFRANTTFS
jgi:hypothetical protein